MRLTFYSLYSLKVSLYSRIFAVAQRKGVIAFLLQIPVVCFGGSTVSLGFRFLDVAFGAEILEIAYGCDSEIFIEIPGQVSGICCWET